ncbi:MAG: 3-oxoacyl-[acyl-carrier-protein] reductase [Dehalococcoidales bacterium]|nr:3-oxoacyl-[acyl-carrier-protein] reductase [Dehalococcoidales bacterium]
MNLEGKIALVTGSGRGIGKAIALRLSGDGAKVIINDVTDESAACAEEIKSAGRPALFLKSNVTSSIEVNAMMDRIIAEYGRIDIVVNNAGITRDQLTLRMTDEEWDAVIAVNLKGVFVCTRAVLKYMMKQRYGRIINISSISGILGNPGQVNYCAAKAGIIGLTRTVSKEMASRHITVNAVAPGFIETDMTASIPDKLKEEFNRRIPAGFFGAPEDVAAAVAFLASDDARYITGQVLCVDGGMVSA